MIVHSNDIESVVSTSIRSTTSQSRVAASFFTAKGEGAAEVQLPAEVVQKDIGSQQKSEEF